MWLACAKSPPPSSFAGWTVGQNYLHACPLLRDWTGQTGARGGKQTRWPGSDLIWLVILGGKGGGGLLVCGVSKRRSRSR